MRVWITKYALTAGIIEASARKTEHDETIMITDGEYKNSFFHNEGKEWTRTNEAAIECAKQMRKKKIDSLKKQIVRLENKKFE